MRFGHLEKPLNFLKGRPCLALEPQLVSESGDHGAPDVVVLEVHLDLASFPRPGVGVVRRSSRLGDQEQHAANKDLKIDGFYNEILYLNQGLCSIRICQVSNNIQTKPPNWNENKIMM